MKKLLALLRFDAVPANVSIGCLTLRLCLGLSIAGLHGWSKLTGFSGMVRQFPDPFGIGSTASLGLAVFAELVCGWLLALGLFTRVAAFFLVLNMSVAFFVVHKGSLAGPQSGELAFIYLAGFLVLLIGGPGRFSLDATLGGKAAAKT
jgi:putative oxidoreductase